MRIYAESVTEVCERGTTADTGVGHHSAPLSFYTPEVKHSSVSVNMLFPEF